MSISCWEGMVTTVLVISSAAIAAEVPVVDAVAQTSESKQLSDAQVSTPTPAIALDREATTTATLESSFPVEFSQASTTFSVIDAPEAAASSPMSEVSSISSLMDEQPTDGMAQVTSVSNLSDVQPTDWAFRALQSLVERDGCIAGYPDGTVRGNRALSRYEFAAGLNACLNRIEELITAATGDLVTQEDLAVVRRLQEAYQSELTTLRGRVDALEVHTATSEVNQVSNTTKLSGVANFVLSGALS